MAKWNHVDNLKSIDYHDILRCFDKQSTNFYSIFIVSLTFMWKSFQNKSHSATEQDTLDEENVKTKENCFAIFLTYNIYNTEQTLVEYIFCDATCLNHK